MATQQVDQRLETISLLREIHVKLLLAPERDMNLIRRIENVLYSTELNDAQRYEAIRRENLLN